MKLAAHGLVNCEKCGSRLVKYYPRETRRGIRLILICEDCFIGSADKSPLSETVKATAFGQPNSEEIERWESVLNRPGQVIVLHNGVRREGDKAG